MDAGTVQVANALGKTLSADNNERVPAEEQLKAFERTEGFGAILLRLVCNVEIPPEIRHVASVKLKNFVRENWEKKENVDEPQAPLPEEERQQLRDLCLTAMFEMTGVYRKQISQTVCLIGKSDFPAQWPTLVTVFAEQFGSDDMDKVTAALTTFEQLVKRYRYESKSNKLWMEIKFVLDNTAQPLTALFLKMMGFAPLDGQTDTMPLGERQAWLEILLLIAKVYHSLISQELPEYFEDNLEPWMKGYMLLLKLKLPAIEESTDSSEANSLDKLKAVICEIVTLYSQRFEEEFMPYMSGFIESIWQLLVEIDHRVRFDTLVNAALDFLSAICQRQQYAQLFQPEGVLQRICEDVVIKNLTLRREDLEQFEDEPFEFLKRDIEGSDLHTRRRGAADFVRALCRQFESELFNILSAAITSHLAEYSQNPQQNWIRKDVVYNLVSAMASKTLTARHGATSTSQLINVSDFYEQYVRPDLLQSDPNEVPILCADALKYMVLFRNQIRPDLIQEYFVGANNVVRLLGSRHFILQHYVGYAIDRLFLVKTANSTLPLLNGDVLKDSLGDLIRELFECFKNQTAYNTHYIMKGIMRCFNVLQGNTAAGAGLYAGYLSSMVQNAIKTPINPQLSHFIFEALCVLIRKAFTSVEGGLDKHVIPVVELILTNDVVDFVPYALQLIALLIDQGEAERKRGRAVSSGQYLNFFPFLLNPVFWSRSANVPALVLVFESFVRSFPNVVFGAEYIDQVLGCFQRLIGSKALDVHGFRIANCFLPHIDSVEKLNSRTILLPMLHRQHNSKTYKFTRNFVIFLCRFAAVRGGMSLATTLESIQNGMFVMVMEKIVVGQLKEMPQTTSFDEKRLIVIGISSIIAETVQELMNQSNLYRDLISAGVAILEAYNSAKAPADEEEEFEGNELEYTDPYCKLSYAQHVDSVGQEVTNVKQYLAQAVLARAAQLRPDSTACIEAPILQTLQTYLNA